jgi:hypothetical protein
MNNKIIRAYSAITTILQVNSFQKSIPKVISKLKTFSHQLCYFHLSKTKDAENLTKIKTTICYSFK